MRWKPGSRAWRKRWPRIRALLLDPARAQAVIAQAPALLLGLAAIGAWFTAPAARPAARVQLRFADHVFSCAGDFRGGRATGIRRGRADRVPCRIRGSGAGRARRVRARGTARPRQPCSERCLPRRPRLCGERWLAPAIAPAALCALALLLISARQFDAARAASIQGVLGALSFAAALSCFAAQGVSATCLLFLTAGTLGVTLALSRPSDAAVEQEAAPDLRGALPIGKPALAKRPAPGGPSSPGPSPARRKRDAATARSKAARKPSCRFGTAYRRRRRSRPGDRHGRSHRRLPPKPLAPLAFRACAWPGRAAFASPVANPE